MTILRATIASVLTVATTVLCHPPIAAAGTYTVHTCQTPTGTWTGNGGWTSDTSAPAQGEEPATALDCTSQDHNFRLRFGLGVWPVSAARAATWTFAAPYGTEINSIALYRSLQLGWPVQANRYGRPYLYDAWHDQDNPGNQLESELPPWNGDTAGVQFPASLLRTSVSWDSVSIRLSCWGQVGNHDCGPFPAEVAISRAEIGLRDDEAPVGMATGGELAGMVPVRGMATLDVHAYDGEGGAYRVALAVDGHEVERHVLDANGGACADVEPGNGDPYEFGTSRPCPPNADGSVQLDTATLRDGAHAVHVTVEDAGGNEATAFDGTVHTHNAPVNATAPALSGQASVGSRLTAAPGQWDGAPTGYDHRWLRCDADGSACAPIAGATGATHTLGDADAYHRIRVDVTAANGSGAATAQSAASAPVADAAGHIVAPPPVQGAGGSGARPVPAPGGIDGIANPLGQLPGHVANGDAASSRARIAVGFQRADGGTVRRVRAGHARRLTIVGRLTDMTGAGIGGAQLGAAWRIPGRGWVARPGVRTAPDGRFAYVLPPGPSRDVRFTYFPFSDSRRVELSNVVHADVLAALAVHVDRQRVSGERVVRLSGRVGGRPIPRAGLLVTLEGFQAGWGWRTFRTVRTDRHGRWSTRYRFRSSRGRFGFRALLPHQGAFPFATSRSAGVFVVVS